MVENPNPNPNPNPNLPHYSIPWMPACSPYFCLNGYACADGGFTCLYCKPTGNEFAPALVCAHDDDWPAAAIWLSKQNIQRFPIIAGVLFLVRTMVSYVNCMLKYGAPQISLPRRYPSYWSPISSARSWAATFPQGPNTTDFWQRCIGCAATTMAQCDNVL